MTAPRPLSGTAKHSGRPSAGWVPWLAWRLVRSRSGRLLGVTSLAAVVGVWLGVMALVIATALMTGFQTDLKAKLLGGIPHLTLYSVRDAGLTGVDEILARIRAVPGVQSAFPVVYAQLLISGPYGNAGAIVKGIPPEARSAIPVLRRVVDGSWDDLSDRDGLVVGVGLAESIGAFAGQRVTVIIPEGLVSPLGIMPRTPRVHIAAVFQSDMYEFDHNWAFVHIDLARRWFRPAGEASAIEVMLDDVDRAPRVRRELERQLRGRGILIETWMEQNQALFSALQLEKWMLFVAITLIVLVASFNIVTHLALLVREKRSRIALLLALGTPPAQVHRLFLIQGLVLGSIGMLGGLVSGVLIAWGLDHYRVIRLPVEVYFIPYLPFLVRPLDALLIAATALAISLGASWIPARQAARLRPAVILRAP